MNLNTRSLSTASPLPAFQEEIPTMKTRIRDRSAVLVPLVAAVSLLVSLVSAGGASAL